MAVLPLIYHLSAQCVYFVDNSCPPQAHVKRITSFPEVEKFLYSSLMCVTCIEHIVEPCKRPLEFIYLFFFFLSTACLGMCLSWVLYDIVNLVSSIHLFLYK